VGKRDPGPTLALGFVARAHGLKGELAIRPFDKDSKSLLSLQRVVLERSGDSAEYVVSSARPTPKETLVFLEGVSTREAAEALKGAQVLAFRADLPEPAEGEYFQADLVGLEVVDEAGKPLGRVEEIWETGPVPNLVIRGSAGELVVPFVDDFVPEVDMAKGRLVVRPPEYVE
jgi:16S rRNA processing protein RimM